jgi:2-iminobutanoate/2-iminopropanoate deaminase
MSRKPVNAAGAAAVGPYSHAIDSDPFVFLSGQTPLDSATGKLVTGSIADQTTQCLKNLAAVLHAAGLDESHVVKCTVFLTDMADFAEMNEVYSAFFTAPRPARSTIGVASLPLGARVEIEMIARR